MGSHHGECVQPEREGGRGWEEKEKREGKRGREECMRKWVYIMLVMLYLFKIYILSSRVGWEVANNSSLDILGG